MKKIRNILLIGLGAIGTLYAALLRNLPGIRFRILVDEKRRLRYQTNGVFLNGEKLDFEWISPDQATGEKVDLILIATKSHGFDSAMEMIAPFVGKDTLILPLLNGITAPASLRKRFSGTEALYGFFLGHASVREGTRVSHDGVGKLYFGKEENHVISPEVSAVAELFDRAGISYEIPGDMKSALWKKYVLNVGVNQASAVFRADYGTLQKNPEMLDFAQHLMEEAVKVAVKAGVNDTEKMVQSAMEVILTMPPQAKTSMLQDILSSRPTEVDLFAGTLCRLGKQYSVEVPCNEEVLKQLS
ncbi:MAG: ketopantoate reductase family protein [Lentisphaeria bacterium]|nr:ketopantoate reductase family protein [Lentisphaeria bacterium]